MNSEQFENVVFTVLEKYKSSNLLLAVSGGADSMALLSVLCSRKKSPRISTNYHELERKVFCLHVEHGLRAAEESQGDADFVKAFCESNGIECRVTHVPPGRIIAYAKRKKIGIEAAARFFRRRALLEEAKRLDNIPLTPHSSSLTANCPPSPFPFSLFPFPSSILTGHTKDDALELSLMRILRGAGPAGLASMPEKRGRFIRPLLGMTRAEIIAYLKEKNIPWREDSTNTDTKFLRNKIRHQLIPFLNNSFPNWQKSITSMSETQSLVNDYLAVQAKNKIKWQQQLPKPQTPNPKPCLTTDEKTFNAQPQIIREQSIYHAINQISSSVSFVSSSCPLCSKISYKSIKRSGIRQFCAGTVKALDLGSVRFKRENGSIILEKTKKNCSESGISRLIKG